MRSAGINVLHRCFVNYFPYFMEEDCFPAFSLLFCRMKHFLRRFRWHILFWTLYFIGWTSFSMHTYHTPAWTALGVTTLWSLGQAVLIYLTIYRWVPRLLQPKHILFFILVLAIGILCSSAFITVTTTWLMRVTIPGYNPPLWPYFGYVMLGNIYWALLAAGLTIVRDRLRNDRRNQRLDKERMENELRFLKSQMNPHFLFNAINSIYVLIRKDPDLAEHTLAQFSDMLRYQLYDCATDLIPVEKEISYLESYAQLEQMRKGSMLSLDYLTEKTVRHFSIAPLLLMPLVENAFKFVSSHPDRNNQVRIRLSFRNPEFHMEISNTVDEPVPAALSHTASPVTPPAAHSAPTASGIGLENVRRRLELLYPGRHTLHIDNGSELYTVTLKILVA